VKTILAAILLLPSGWSPGVAQTPIDAVTKDDVQQLISLTDYRQQMNLMIKGMMQQLSNVKIDQYKRTHPSATPAEIAKVEQCVSSTVQVVTKNYPFDEMIDAIVPIYQRHLTHSDMQSFIEF
jgi:hypothetical protein